MKIIYTHKYNIKIYQMFSKFMLICLLLLFFIHNRVDAAEGKISVVASIAPLADFVRQVGSDKVDVILLLPPGASPHTFEPTPKMMQAISRSKLFVMIGSGLEFWADRVIRSVSSNILTVNSSEGIDLLDMSGNPYLRSKGSHPDPHIWLDPVLCISIVNKIAKALSEIDPSNSDFYKKNASSYLEKLSELDREISIKVKSFSKREFITFHPAWNYFARRYRLKIAGVIEEGPGKEPSAKHLDRILKEIKRINCKVIFAEPQFNPKMAEAIAREAGAKVLFLDPEGGQKGRESYIETMKYNLSVMEKAMK